jgi:hypothetical protein
MPSQRAECLVAVVEVEGSVVDGGVGINVKVFCAIIFDPELQNCDVISDD